MSRVRVARELQSLIEQADKLLAEAEGLARSSRLINPSYFGGARSSMRLAAGDLDQQGLLERGQIEAQPEPPA